MYLQIAPRRSPADNNGAREVRSSLQTEYLFTSRAFRRLAAKNLSPNRRSLHSAGFIRSPSRFFKQRLSVVLEDGALRLPKLPSKRYRGN